MSALHLASTCILVIGVIVSFCDADSPRAFKTTRTVDPAKGLRLESGCAGCFPHDYKGCEKDLWKRCCDQEILCHDHHCREAVMGKLEANVQVRIREAFVSDDDQRVQLRKGMKGKVLRVDGEGDAYIKFFEDDLDNEGVKHWVYKTTFWKTLELIGKPERLRASNIVSCLDSCSAEATCAMQHLSKKELNRFQKCMTSCKLEICQQEEKCKSLLTAYALCKEDIARSGICNAVEHSKAAEL